MKRYIYIVILSMLAFDAWAQQAQNRPYADDKLFHFGFQLGVNFASFGVTDSEMELTDPVTGLTDIYHARVSSVLPGFHVGFITDLRLCQYLNLRFCPGMQFSSRTLSYKSESGRKVQGTPGKTGPNVDVLAMPVNLPLYLKWSAMREGNYRPYVIGGGGVSVNVSRDRDKPVLLNMMAARRSHTASVLQISYALPRGEWSYRRRTPSIRTLSHD